VTTASILHTGIRGLATEMVVLRVIAGEVAVGQQMGVLSVETNHGRVEALEDECTEVGRMRVAVFAGGVACEHMEEEELQLLADRRPGDDSRRAERIVASCGV
jgi:hypothetical protein